MKHFLFIILCILIGMSCTDTTPTVTFKDESGIITVNVDTAAENRTDQEARPVNKTSDIQYSRAGMLLTTIMSDTASIIVLDSLESARVITMNGSSGIRLLRSPDNETVTITGLLRDGGQVEEDYTMPLFTTHIASSFTDQQITIRPDTIPMTFIWQDANAKVFCEIPGRYWAYIPRTIAIRDDGFDDCIVTISQMKDLVNVSANWPDCFWEFKLPPSLKNKQISCDDWTPRQAKLITLSMLEAEYGN